jgi:hypothetical protein
MSLIDAIDANLDNLVDPKNRCVEATDAAANELVIAATEESPDELQELMFMKAQTLYTLSSMLIWLKHLLAR